MLNEAFQLSFFGKLGLTLPNLGKNPAFMIIWKKNLKKKIKKNFKKKSHFPFISLADYLVFDVRRQIFQFLTLKPQNLFDANKE